MSPSSSTTAPQPPTHLNLLHIISHLIPPHYPLPPHLLSTPLKTRHLYLPPSMEDKMDDGYISQPERLGQEEEDAGMKGMKSRSLTERLFSISSKLEDYRRSIDLDRVQGESGSSSSSTSPYAHDRQPRGGQGRSEADLERSLGAYVGGLRGGLRYSKRDRETLLVKVQMKDDLGSLAGTPLQQKQQGLGPGPGLGGRQTESDAVDLILLYEPEDPTDLNLLPSTTTTTDANPDRSDWKLYNITLPSYDPSSSSSSGSSSAELDQVWSPVIPVDHERGVGGVGAGAGQEAGGEVGEMGGQPGDPDDFWGGYEDDDQHDEHDQITTTTTKAGVSTADRDMAAAIDLTEDSPPSTTRLDTHPATIPQEPPSSTSTFPMEDDSYWASYGSVEDGLRPSNPPTPGGFGSASGMGVGRHFTPSLGRQQAGGEKDYWGTGGETPVGWSPPIKEIQLYPEEEDEEEIEVEPPVVVTSTKGAHPGDLSITPTTSEPLVNSSTTHQPPPSNDNPTDPISVERHRRRETLKSTLSALRAMYAGDEQEWKEVLREVGEGK